MSERDRMYLLASSQILAAHMNVHVHYVGSSNKGDEVINIFVHVKMSLQLLPLLLNAYTPTLAQAHTPPHDPSVPPPLPPRPGPGHALYRYVVSALFSVHASDN